MDLSKYRQGEVYKGKRLKTLSWYYCSLLIFENGWVPLYGLKRLLLKIFGAQVGAGVCIKPNVKIKFPWNLCLGDYAAVGEGAWIDNLGMVTVGSNSVISQGSYLCTGNHDYRAQSFDLIIGEITIGAGCWIGANSMLLPGTVVADDAVVGAGAVVKGYLEGGKIHTLKTTLSSNPRW